MAAQHGFVNADPWNLYLTGASAISAAAGTQGQSNKRITSRPGSAAGLRNHDTVSTQCIIYN
jgi:hypothetical protein